MHKKNKRQKKKTHTHTHSHTESRKIVHKIVNFGSPKLTKPKKKSKNTTKFHNNFTIHLFLVVVAIDLIFYFIFILTKEELTPQ